eukprot:3881233-Amphidinium_carterae.1
MTSRATMTSFHYNDGVIGDDLDYGWVSSFHLHAFYHGSFIPDRRVIQHRVPVLEVTSISHFDSTVRGLLSLFHVRLCMLRCMSLGHGYNCIPPAGR